MLKVPCGLDPTLYPYCVFFVGEEITRIHYKTFSFHIVRTFDENLCKYLALNYVDIM